MLKSREEILKQCGELIDTIGELFDEKIKYERKFCEESRKRKEAETELAKSNFKLEKIKAQINQLQIMGMKPLQAFKDDLLKILEGTNE